MTILVTGANGGLGKVLLPILKKKYKELVVGTARTFIKNADYIPCDLTDATAVASLILEVKPRLIFHLAGSFTGDFEIDLQVNTLSSKYIYDCILREKLKSRVVVFGSAAEYGAVNPSDNPISETYLCSPVSIYGLTKHYQTEMAKFYSRTFSLDVVIARVFNLAIAELSPRLFYGRAFAMIQAYKRNQVNQMEFGNLSSVRDYVGLEDAAAQFVAIADFGISGEVYNVGSGVPKNIRAILLEILNREGFSIAAIIEKSSEAVGRKGFDVPVIYADISKINSILNA